MVFLGCHLSRIKGLKLKGMEIQFTTQIFKEGRSFVAYTRELDVSSCGGTQQKALRNLKEAARLFLEEAEKMGALDRILEEAGYLKRKTRLLGPKFITTLRVSLPLPLEHAKAQPRLVQNPHAGF